MSTARITLYKSIDNTFDFIIKKDKSTLPLELTDTDTFILYITDLATNTTVATLTSVDSVNGSITITDKINGKITIVVKQALVATLKSLRGTQADNYYVKPTYSFLISANTANQGKFIATLDKVGVK